MNKVTQSKTKNRIRALDIKNMGHKHTVLAVSFSLSFIWQRGKKTNQKTGRMNECQMWIKCLDFQFPIMNKDQNSKKAAEVRNEIQWKKQHAHSYSRDNVLNLLCMKRDAGRGRPEIAEGFTGQGRNTVICTRSTYGSVWGFVALTLRAWRLLPHATISYLNHRASAHVLLCRLGGVRRWRSHPRSQDLCLHPIVPKEGRCLVSVGLSFWLEIKLCCGLAADLNCIAFLHICQKCLK